MPRGSLIQNTFNSGAWGRDMYGRTDIPKYQSASKTIENFIVKAQGGLVRRSGYIYSAEVDDSDKRSRLIPFVFNQEQAYVIELTPLGARVFLNTGVEVMLDTPIVTPYTESQLGDIVFTQSADVMYLTHQSHPPAKINRNSDTDFEYEVIDFQDGPYDPVNGTEDTMAPNVTGVAFGAAGYPTNYAVDASEITSSAAGTTFTADDIGRHIRINQGDIWGWAEITGITSGSVAQVTIYSPFNSTSASLIWRMSAWGSAADRLYPKICSFFEQRLSFANNIGGPNLWYGSESVDFESFAPTTTDNLLLDSSSLGYSLYSNGVDAIEWMAPSRSLILGTSDGIWSAQATSFLDPITPGNIQMKPTARRGASSVQPVQIENMIFYASVANRRLNALVYTFNSDSYDPKEMTLANLDATKGGIEYLAYEEEPHRILWVQRANGALSGLTVLREQEVAAWHNHTVGGSFGTGATVVESSIVTPAPGNTSDRHWIIAKRTIDGVTKRFIEYRDVTFDDTTALEDGVFVDSALTYSGVATTAPTGWAHLEGETVQVLADGAAVADAVVSGGGITLDVAASKVTAGLKYNSDLETLNLLRPDPQGTSQGRSNIRSKVTARLLDTVAGKVGPAFDNLTPIRYEQQGPYLYSGDVDVDLEDYWSDRDQTVCIRQDQPYPMTISALMIEYLGSEF